MRPLVVLSSAWLVRVGPSRPVARCL